MKIATLILTSSMICVLSACAWVETQPGAEQIRILSAQPGADCQHIADTSVSIRDRVAAIQRKPGKVAQELETLARNSALDTGANALLPLGPVINGKREYAIYRCE